MDRSMGMYLSQPSFSPMEILRGSPEMPSFPLILAAQLRLRLVGSPKLDIQCRFYT